MRKAKGKFHKNYPTFIQNIIRAIDEVIATIDRTVDHLVSGDKGWPGLTGHSINHLPVWAVPMVMTLGLPFGILYFIIEYLKARYARKASEGYRLKKLIEESEHFQGEELKNLAEQMQVEVPMPVPIATGEDLNKPVNLPIEPPLQDPKEAPVATTQTEEEREREKAEEERELIIKTEVINKILEQQKLGYKAIIEEINHQPKKLSIKFEKIAQQQEDEKSKERIYFVGEVDPSTLSSQIEKISNKATENIFSKHILYPIWRGLVEGSTIYWIMWWGGLFVATVLGITLPLAPTAIIIAIPLAVVLFITIRAFWIGLKAEKPKVTEFEEKCIERVLFRQLKKAHLIRILNSIAEQLDIQLSLTMDDKKGKKKVQEEDEASENKKTEIDGEDEKEEKRESFEQTEQTTRRVKEVKQSFRQRHPYLNMAFTAFATSIGGFMLGSMTSWILLDALLFFAGLAGFTVMSGGLATVLMVGAGVLGAIAFGVYYAIKTYKESERRNVGHKNIEDVSNKESKGDEISSYACAQKSEILVSIAKCFNKIKELMNSPNTGNSPQQKEEAARQVAKPPFSEEDLVKLEETLKNYGIQLEKTDSQEIRQNLESHKKNKESLKGYVKNHWEKHRTLFILQVLSGALILLGRGGSGAYIGRSFVWGGIAGVVVTSLALGPFGLGALVIGIGTVSTLAIIAGFGAMLYQSYYTLHQERTEVKHSTEFAVDNIKLTDLQKIQGILMQIENKLKVVPNQTSTDEEMVEEVNESSAPDSEEKETKDKKSESEESETIFEEGKTESDVSSEGPEDNTPYLAQDSVLKQQKKNLEKEIPDIPKNQEVVQQI
jgi:hypothetical protein